MNVKCDLCVFHQLACQWMLQEQTNLPDSAHSGDPSRPLSVTAVLNNSSDFAAVCSKRTEEDRHLLLTTDVDSGGET